jgi:hypothetical protein
VKGFPSFGAPEERRFQVQFAYDTRPSFWARAGANAHLVVAGIGTTALLGVAAVALWLALPAQERQANASPKQSLEEIVPARPVKTTKVASPSKPVQAATVAAPKEAEPPITRTTPKGDAVSPRVAAADMDVPALAPDDPRWNAGVSAADAATPVDKAQPQQPPASSGAEAAQAVAAPASAKTAPAEPNPAQAALAPTPADAPAARAEPTSKDRADVYQTAAIPAIKPATPEPAATDDATDDAEVKAPATETAKPETHTERVQSGVTMRTGPKNEASAITTIPGKTAVEVVSCSAWCEIIYKGRRGFIYKSFLGRGEPSRPKPTKVSAPAKPKQPAAAEPAPAKPEAAEVKKSPIPGAGTFGHR